MRAQIEEFLERKVARDPAEGAASWAGLAEAAAKSLLAREGELAARVAELHNFSAHESRRAVRGALEPIRSAELMRIWERRFGAATGERRWPDLAVVFGGGAIPQPSVQAVVAAGMVARRVLLRPSRQDPFLAGALIEEMARIDPREVEGRVLVATWPYGDESLARKIVGRADSLTIFGGGEAVDTLRAMARPDCQAFIYGPRVSFAAIDLAGCAVDDYLERSAEEFAEDLFAFDQRGCLSPTTLYLIGGEADGIDAILGELAKALDARAREQEYAPQIPAAAAEAIHSLRAVYSMSAGRRCIQSGPGLPGWTLLIDSKDAALRPTPGYQTAFVSMLPSWNELPAAIAAAEREGLGVQAMGYAKAPMFMSAGFKEAMREIVRMGVSRACPLGEMQSPPLDWTHDGNPFFPWRG